MAVKKATKAKKPLRTTAVKKTISSQKQRSTMTNFFSNLRFGESYTSLVLGVIAVVIATVLLLSFFSNRHANKPDEEVVPTIADVETLDITTTPTTEPSQANVNKIYTIVAGDSLWKIAEKAYGSGYKWVDIAKANKLINPNNIHAGNKLILPQIFSKINTVEVPTVHTADDDMSSTVSPLVKIINETYTVMRGDNLWTIAVRAYGDGYQWTKIARANNLINPNVIHAGNILKIPRN